MEYFNGKTGRFLDIGGYLPFNLSNTMRLYELVWSGVVMEPSPKCFKEFEKVYSGDKRMVILNAAFAESDGKIRLYEVVGDALSTINKSFTQKWLETKFNEIEVNSICSHTLFKTY